MTDETRQSLTKTVPHACKEWRCFHCDEVFTDPKAAANHFGVDHLGSETLCQMAQVDGGIARVVADLAEELDRYRREDNESFREFYRIGADHVVALRNEEQKGYDRGLADARREAAVELASHSLRIQGLEAALAPFAKFADSWRDIPGVVKTHPDVELWQKPVAVERSGLTVGDLRRAKALLEPLSTLQRPGDNR